MSKKINYINRDFSSTRSDLVNLIKESYPTLMSDFNDASVGSVFIDLNAAVSDMLSYHTDRMFNETQLEYAQEYTSLQNMAKTLGVRLPGNRPSVTLIDFSVKVPVNGGEYDKSYAPIIKRGSQVSGNGYTFELSDDIDFSQPFSSDGIPNQKIIPNYNALNTIISYTIVKREIVKNGSSKIYSKTIGINETKPFHSIVLPDDNILEIESIIFKEGTNLDTPSNNEFLSDENRFYEVESLVDSKVFVEVGTSENGLKLGKWKNNTKRFITEYTNNGYMKVTFGGSNKTGNIMDSIDNVLGSDTLYTDEMISTLTDILNNNSLGEGLKSGTTIFIKYRVGGGDSSNIPSGTITSLTNIDMVVNGSNQTYNRDVKNSLSVNNPIPAFGGRSKPTIEEIRALIKFNYQSQNRAVTLKDYYGLIGKMPGKFGAPYRYSVSEEQNKIVINIISKDSENKITSNNSSSLINNITEFLSEYRMINDYVVVKSGKVINIGVNVDILLQKNVTASQVVSEVSTVISDYFSPSNFNMGDDIYLSNLYEKINSVNGVLNVVNIEIENKYLTPYSDNISNFSTPNDTGQYFFDLNEMVLSSDPNSIYEIRYPEKDIKIRVK